MSLLGCTRGIWDMEAMAKHRQVGRIEQRDFVMFFNWYSLQKLESTDKSSV